MAQKKRKSLTDEELVKKYGDLEAKEDFSKTVKKIAPKPKKDINQLDSVQPIVKKMVEKGSRLISDEWHAYTGLNSEYDHYIVNHAGKEYVNTLDSSIHSNTIEGFWTGLKKSVIAVYHKVSRKHLQKYADESAFRYNTIGLTTTERFNKMLQKSDKRLTYKMLING